MDYICGFVYVIRSCAADVIQTSSADIQVLSLPQDTMLAIDKLHLSPFLNY